MYNNHPPKSHTLQSLTSQPEMTGWGALSCTRFVRGKRIDWKLKNNFQCEDTWLRNASARLDLYTECWAPAEWCDLAQKWAKKETQQSPNKRLHNSTRKTNKYAWLHFQDVGLLQNNIGRATINHNNVQGRSKMQPIPVTFTHLGTMP